MVLPCTLYHSILLAQTLNNVIFNLTMHIGKYFEFVEIKLRILTAELAELTELGLEHNEDRIKMQLKSIVDHHNQAIDFVAQIEAVISPIMLINYVINIFTFCFTSFILIVV